MARSGLTLRHERARRSNQHDQQGRRDATAAACDGPALFGLNERCIGYSTLQSVDTHGGETAEARGWAMTEDGADKGRLIKHVQWRIVPVTRASMPRSSAEDTTMSAGAVSEPIGLIIFGKRRAPISFCTVICEAASPRLDFDLTGERLGI